MNYPFKKGYKWNPKLFQRVSRHPNCNRKICKCYKQFLPQSKSPASWWETHSSVSLQITYKYPWSIKPLLRGSMLTVTFGIDYGSVLLFLSQISTTADKQLIRHGLDFSLHPQTWKTWVERHRSEFYYDIILPFTP